MLTADGREADVYPELKSPDVQPGLGAAVLAALSRYDGGGIPVDEDLGAQ